MLETVPLDFTEYDITWVSSKLSGATGALGAEAIELINWLLCSGCVSEELRVVVDTLADWMSNSSVNLIVRVNPNKQEGQRAKLEK